MSLRPVAPRSISAGAASAASPAVSSASSNAQGGRSAGRATDPFDLQETPEIAPEETGLVLALRHWVLKKACAQLLAWAGTAETARIEVAVNVSARQFHHPGYVADVLALVAAAGIDPRRLKLELTETSLLANLDDTIARMHLLKAHGVTFALDDFGTGYSSLAYLKRLPLDMLKIDRSFVLDLLTDENDAVIARTIIALGRSLGLRVLAEGVETVAQRDFLFEHGCDAYQGYLCARALPADEAAAVICKP